MTDKNKRGSGHRMNDRERALARHLFQNKIFKADGQAFEDLFSSIMNYAEADFQQIKPWGNIGDGKNDGYIKSKDIYYQVWAPEDIRKSYTEAVAKLVRDFSGLMEHWSPINEFYFVINDKYKGVNADSEIAIQGIKEEHDLDEAKILTPKDLENILFTLLDDEILSITGFIPDPAEIKTLDYSVLSEVISYIMKLSLNEADGSKIKLPDWEGKIIFNDLSISVSTLLENGFIQVGSLDQYLKNNSDFLADLLRDKMNEIYLQEKEKNSGDDLFWAIVNTASPKAEQQYQIPVIIIMSKYFETCDIFEEPEE